MSPIINRADVEELSEAHGAASRIFTSIDPAPESKLTFAEVAIEKGQGTSAHKHKLTEEIYYVTGGRGEMRLDDDRSVVVPGDCIVIPPGVLHELRNDEGSQPLVFLATCTPVVDPDDFYEPDGTKINFQLSGAE